MEKSMHINLDLLAIDDYYKETVLFILAIACAGTNEILAAKLEVTLNSGEYLIFKSK